MLKTDNGSWQPSFDDFITLVANQREEIHENHSSSRPLSEDYERVGMAGEFAFGQFSGLMPDVEIRPGGDGGIDFTIGVRFTVDVKTARKPSNLIHEIGKPFADIFVLAKYDDEAGTATLLGWCHGSDLQTAPTRDFGFKVINHYIPAGDLKPMSMLKKRLIRW